MRGKVKEVIYAIVGVQQTDFCLVGVPEKNIFNKVNTQ